MSDEQANSGGGTVEPEAAGNGEIVPARNRIGSAELMRFLADVNNDTDKDPEQVAIDIVERILKATSAEEVFGRTEPVGISTLLERPLEVDSVSWMKSSLDEGPGAYALVEGTDLTTGEKFLATCGGRNVMAQLWKLNELDALPARVKVQRTSKPTAGGYYPLWLAPAGV